MRAREVNSLGELMKSRLDVFTGVRAVDVDRHAGDATGGE